MWKPWSSGIDWITATAPRGSDAEGVLAELARKELGKHKQMGLKVGQCTLDDYKGWKSEHMFTGRRKDGTYCRVSSDPAHAFTLKLLETGAAVQVTTLHVETTAQCEAENYHFARELFTEFAGKKFKSPSGKELGGRLHFSPKKGDTFRLGAAQSARHTDIYNKSYEQRGKVAPGLWRAEVKHNKKIAGRVYKMLGDCESTVLTCRDIVGATLEAQGIRSDWLGERTEVRLPTTYRQEDWERTCAWAELQVAPALIKVAKQGHAEDVLASLHNLLRVLEELTEH